MKRFMGDLDTKVNFALFHYALDYAHKHEDKNIVFLTDRTWDYLDYLKQNSLTPPQNFHVQIYSNFNFNDTIIVDNIDHFLENQYKIKGYSVVLQNWYGLAEYLNENDIREVKNESY